MNDYKNPGIPLKQPVFHGKDPAVFFRGSSRTNKILTTKITCAGVETRIVFPMVGDGHHPSSRILYNYPY